MSHLRKANQTLWQIFPIVKIPGSVIETVLVSPQSHVVFLQKGWLDKRSKPFRAHYDHGFKNWIATVLTFSSEGRPVDRKFWKSATVAGFYEVPKDLKVGDVIESAVDTCFSEQKVFGRTFFKVLEVGATALKLEEIRA